MLDLEILVPPTHTGLDIVSLAEMKKHLRTFSSALDDQISSAVKEAAGWLDGPGGILNRTVFPCTWARYLRGFPTGRVIPLPYPPLIAVQRIVYSNGESPDPEIYAGNYVVRTNLGAVGEIELQPDVSWPTVTERPRRVGIVYTAGYQTYPETLKRLVKIIAGHYLENPEATINEVRQFQVNRATLFGVTSLVEALRISASYDDWE